MPSLPDVEARTTFTTLPSPNRCTGYLQRQRHWAVVTKQIAYPVPYGNWNVPDTELRGLIKQGCGRNEQIYHAVTPAVNVPKRAFTLHVSRDAPVEDDHLTFAANLDQRTPKAVSIGVSAVPLRNAHKQSLVDSSRPRHLPKLTFSIHFGQFPQPSDASIEISHH